MGALVVAIAAIYFSLSYKGVFYAPDEGATAYHFEKSVEGAIQHRDFYSVYGMAYYILGENLFKLFGSNLMVMRTFALVLKLCIAILIYCTALNLVRPGFAFISALGFIIWWGDPFIATPSYLYPALISQLLGLAGVFLLFSYIKSTRRLYVLSAGMAAGLSSLFKPNVGAFNLLALFLFFLVREIILDLRESPAKFDAEDASPKLPLGRIGLMIELGAVLGVAIVSLALFGKFGFGLAAFSFTLLPFYLAIACLLMLGFKALGARADGVVLWKIHKETLGAYLLLGGGFVFWQIVQVAYFAKVGALKDFLYMLSTATSYYNNYAIPFWNGSSLMTACGLALLIGLGLRAAAKATAGLDPRRKILLSAVVLLLAAALPVSWYARQAVPARHHFVMWCIPLSFSMLASLFLMSRDALKGEEGKKVSGFLGLSLITLYAATNLLDAYPKVDPGHFFMIMPPVFVLFGLLGERFYDSWKGYLAEASPRIGGAVAGTAIGLIALGVFLPSLFMMVSFHFLIVPSSDEGYYLHGGKLALVPRVPAGIERAKGIAIHTFGERYRPPLVEPEAKYIFDVVRRISAITQKGDKLFATTTSALMIYFLADRDSMSDTANCYVWQTAMGTTTSDTMKDFSDRNLTRMIDTERPKAIVVEKEDIETKRFVANWPTAWNFIMANYRVAESIGPFQIYTPAR
ncbi:MAG: hypothetical protein HQ583_09715 [Candidatus Abyssubacteria bacterium]|nr:hypothetical protein [Candidatus Abyssubacteria bacterium]